MICILTYDEQESVVVFANDVRVYKEHLQDKNAPVCRFLESFVLSTTTATTQQVSMSELVDHDVDSYLKYGCLVRVRQFVSQEERYWIQIPNTGHVLRAIRDSRQQFTKFLQARRYKQILLGELLASQKQFSPVLDLLFIVRDVVGRQLVRWRCLHQGLLLVSSG